MFNFDTDSNVLYFNLAGYGKNDIVLEHKNSYLILSTAEGFEPTKMVPAIPPTKVALVGKGRKVGSASLENGLLKVTLEDDTTNTYTIPLL